VLTQSLIR